MNYLNHNFLNLFMENKTYYIIKYLSREEMGEELYKVWKKYYDSHQTFYPDGLIGIIPMKHSQESFIDEFKNNRWFRFKWKYLK